MRNLITIIFIFITLILNAQCPVTIASLGNGNGLQVCWVKGERPLNLDTIYLDSTTYAGADHNGGQLDCWRTTEAATLDVLGNHMVEFMFNSDTLACTFKDGVSTNGPMAIKIISFEAETHENSVFLYWEIKGYIVVDVLKSYNGINFDKIAADITGSYEDTQFKAAFVYYKLSILDMENEKVTETRIIAVKNRSVKKVIIYPNPVSRVLFVDSDAAQTIEIIDLMGRTVGKYEIGIESQIDIKSLKNGNYFIKITTEDGVQVKKIQKR